MSEPRYAALTAEFESAEALATAAERLRADGYRRVECFSPFPLPATERPSRLGLIAFVGGLIGFCGGVAWTILPTTQLYPMIVGGRRPDALLFPAFLPVIFELTILGAALAAFIGLFVILRLPRWHHPLFALERFARVTDDGFLLVVDRHDPRFCPDQTPAFLASLGGQNLITVEDEA